MLTMLGSLCMGVYPVPAGTVLRIVGSSAWPFHSAGDYSSWSDKQQIVVLMIRLPRILLAVLAGAGLPQLRGQVGRAKSYAERLFEFPEIGPLPDDAARDAILKPVLDEGAEISEAALAAILDKTQRYPYFLQEWGKHAWDTAQASPISRQDVELASQSVTAALDESFFRVRFDRLTPAEKKYLRAMAELGAGPHRSGDIALELKRVVTALGPTRNQLISKGMVWSPSHGDTAFTVPLFDQFMHRIMPGKDWKE